MKKCLSLVMVLVFAMSLMSVATFSASAASTVLYKFTFEADGAETILKKGGVAIGEIVEWPAGSGNHCIAYTVDSATRTGGGGVHPYIWPSGVGGVLATQGDIEAGGMYELSVDFAYSLDTAGSYMYPFMLTNGADENYFTKGYVYTPIQDEFTTFCNGFELWEGGVPLPGQDNGGIGFCDEGTLEEGGTMYVDNIQLVKIGDWTPVTDGFIGYGNGTPAEESDVNNGTTPPPPSSTQSTQSTTQSTQSTQSTVPSGEGDKNPGDANVDGAVDMKDVLSVRKHLANMLVLEGAGLANADANGDGTVDMKDVLTVRKALAGM